MAQPADQSGGLTNLQKRILSAAVLLPVVIAAIAFGHPYFTLLVTAFAGVIGWEWTRVAAHIREPGRTSPVPNPPAAKWGAAAFLVISIAVLAALTTGFEGNRSQAIFILGLGVVLVGSTVLTSERRSVGWRLAGMFYAAVPAIALIVLRNDPMQGRATLLWIIALVVAADTGGYLVGRTIGGPKLAPRISPNKTWSGLGGAVAGAALVGLLTAFVLNHTDVWMLTLISAGLGLVEQAGDLVESAFKRHFGVKDTSQIIPGHGGVLDRVDGLLAVAVAALALSVWAGGSVLAW